MQVFIYKKYVLNRLFWLFFKMRCVTSDESQDVCGVEKLFCSLWKEIAGQALCSHCVLSRQNTSTCRGGESCGVWRKELDGRWTSQGNQWRSAVGLCQQTESELGQWRSHFKDIVLLEEFALIRQEVVALCLQCYVCPGGVSLSSW